MENAPPFLPFLSLMPKIIHGIMEYDQWFPDCVKMSKSNVWPLHTMHIFLNETTNRVMNCLKNLQNTL